MAHFVRFYGVIFINCPLIHNLMLERVQKIMARAGVASRRKSETLIAEGKVKVNGEVIKLGDKADAYKDHITVNGEKIKLDKAIYFIMNKPKQCICAVTDKRYVTVVDLVEELVFPVGRLDRDTEGLLLLTNDGEFANRVIHPSQNVDKVYIAVLDKSFRDVGRLRKGVMIGKIKVIPKYVKIVDRKRVEICVHSGITHVVKILFKRLGYHVRGLKRIRLGKLTMKGLKPGHFRKLNQREVDSFVVQSS